jgi:hypothetical protein
MAQADSKNSITAPVDTTRRRFLTVAAAGAMSVAAVSATALPLEVDTELVRAAQDLVAVEQAIDDLCRKYDEADGRDDYRALEDRRNENIATLITVQATSAAGIQAKAASLRLRAMIADQDQHQQISVSLADDLVVLRPEALMAAASVTVLALPTTRAAAPVVDPIYEVIERHRKACREHNEALDIHMAFEESGMEGEKLAKYKRLVAATDAAYDELEEAGLDLINTRPTTPAGIVALCQYIKPLFAEDEAPDLPEYILYDDGSTAYPAEAFAYVIGRAVAGLGAELDSPKEGAQL